MITRTDVREEFANDANTLFNPVDDVIEHVLTYVGKVGDEIDDCVEVVFQFFDNFFANKFCSAFDIACQDITDEGASCETVILKI